MKEYFGVSYAKSNLGIAMLTGLIEMTTKYHFTMSYNSFISDLAEDSLEDAAMDEPLELGEEAAGMELGEGPPGMEIEKFGQPS